MRELIAAAKAKPGALTYGSAGIGTGGFMSAELLNMQAQIKMTHVPYKGSNEAFPDLLAGRISAVFTTLPVVAGFMVDSRLKVLAVASAKRSASAPDLPTIAESGLPGFDVTPWFGLAAPKGTTGLILKTLADAIEDVASGDDVKKQLAAIGGERISLSLDQFRDFMAREVPKWAKVVDFAGIKPQ